MRRRKEWPYSTLWGDSTLCCTVLVKHRRKVKGEQVITFQIAQQLKTKNIDVVSGQQFCRQCKAKFLLEVDSLY